MLISLNLYFFFFFSLLILKKEVTIAKTNINIKKIFSPEHGFKGDKSAGEFVDDSIDELSGTEIISLYGIKKNPSKKNVV